MDSRKRIKNLPKKIFKDEESIVAYLEDPSTAMAPWSSEKFDVWLSIEERERGTKKKIA